MRPLTLQEKTLLIDFCINEGLMKPDWLLRLFIWIATRRGATTTTYWRNVAAISPKTIESFHLQLIKHWPNFNDEEKAKIEKFLVPSRGKYDIFKS